MAQFFQSVGDVLSTLGSSFCVPVMLFIIALFMGCKGQKAFRAALLCAAGLTGFSLVINSYSGIIAPVVQSMVDSTGVKLSCLDVGWQAFSVIAYGTQVGLIWIGICIILQIVLFLCKFTDVFMASDLWNNYSFMIWGSLVYFHTKSFAFALICMLVQLLYILLFSEAFAKRFSTFYNYPQCCMTAPHHLEGLPFAVIMNWILGKIGFDKIKINATTLQKKLGIFGEPMFIGLVVGALIGFLGNINDLTTVAGWGSIITAAVSTAAIMAVFPRVAGIFAGAFTIITDAYKSKAAEKGKDRDWYLSVNDAVAYGEPNTLAAGILSIPIILILSFVLPGNIILPMADLVALPYMSEVFCATSNGNIAKTVAMNVIWFSLGMIIVSQFCPAMTQIAIEQGVNLADYNAAGVSIVSFGVLCHPFIVGLFAAFWFQNYIAIAIIIVVYVVLYVLFKKNRYTFVDWMENQAAKHQL